MNKAEELKAIHEKWIKECTCELKHTATQAVPGVGSADAKIIFIGEAPGRDEDRQGEPFVGAAGKFLNEMLAEIDMKREDIYITNIVKYRPPNNRDPLPEEKEACKEWLYGELRLISPKLIVFLGRHAMNNFFPELKISSVHGKLLTKTFTEIPTRYFFPLFHPAAALYTASMRTTLIEDFKKIPKVLEEIAVRESAPAKEPEEPKQEPLRPPKTLFDL